MLLNQMFVVVYVYSVIQTQCLGGLLTYFSSNGNTVAAASFDEMPAIQRTFQWLNVGHVHAAGIVLCSLFSIVINNEFNMYAVRLGMQIRAICGSLLYRQVYIQMSHCPLQFHFSTISKKFCVDFIICVYRR